MRWFSASSAAGKSAVLAASVLSGTAYSTPVSSTSRHVSARAFPDSPTGGYTPGVVECPSGNLVRAASGGISNEETEWVKERHKETNVALTSFLNRASMVDFDIATFLNDGKETPNIGIAFSGGGYRAMLNGAGVFAAVDSRTTGANKAGHMGGLLQSATYIAGLSGGSWMMGSLVVNNFTTVEKLQNDKDLWDLKNSILAPEGALSILDTTSYYNELRNQVDDKRKAGFDPSLTDYWGLALARQFISNNGGAAVTYSSISKTDTFKKAQMPFPIVVADGRHPGELVISTNATVFEFNPFEMGSFDPTLYAFSKLQYIGTNVTNGKPDDSKRCIRGFDNAGFILGTSSSLFNIGLLNLQSYGLTGILKKFAESVLGTLNKNDADIADYSPNPFHGVHPEINPSANTRELTLVDGGLDGQNVPLHPLIQPARALDIIFAVDSSADVVNWPNGTSLVATYERSLSPMQNRTAFPAIPDVNTFVNLGLNKRPTFFGCDAKNITKMESAPYPPLIVYIPNHPYTTYSNTSTMQMKYERSQRNDIIQNGYNVMTMGNGTVDAEWAACAGCAIVRRGEERRGLTQTDQCKKCFQRYCWDGTRASTVPKESVVEQYSILIASKTSGANRKKKTSKTVSQKAEKLKETLTSVFNCGPEDDDGDGVIEKEEKGFSACASRKMSSRVKDATKKVTESIGLRLRARSGQQERRRRVRRRSMRN
ncbi:lysophospholipase [Peziza echinospora]|nr:lysophospholipase [Peziza echinospora]